MGIALKGDFIGFWIGDTHSSELGIIRTSDGSRFNENLLPTIQDKTVQVPGGDGFYYFGSYYTQRPFNIPIAFDNMSEAQFRRLKQIIGSKEMVQLVFDEAPYKYYSVKSTGSPILKYVCFDVEDDSSGGNVGDLYAQATPARSTKTRVYKGEGTLSFIAYDPFGYARALSISDLRLPREMTTKEEKERFSDLFDFSEDEDENRFLNEGEWAFTMKDSSGEYQYPLPTDKQTGIWNNSQETSSFQNSGDLPADYQIFCELKTADNNNTIKIISVQVIDGNLVVNGSIFLELQVHNTNVERFCFDSKTNCVYSYNEDGTINYNDIYNSLLVSGKFDKIPVGNQVLLIQGVSEAPIVNIKFKYF